jgi:hypothetical protein
MTVLIRNLNWDRARTIARATQVEGAVPIYAHRFPVGLWTFAVHDLLASSATETAETWDMKAAEMPRLVRTLEVLFEHIPEEFGVEVIWGGNALEERNVSRREMLGTARRGKIGTRVRYRIQAASD